MKKRLLALAGLLGPGLLFAETTAPEGLSDAVTQLQGAATSTLDTIRPAVVAVVVALFAIVGIGLAFKYIKRFINR